MVLILNLPLLKLNIDYEVVSEKVVVALSSQLPIDGVVMLLGNDLAGGREQAKVTAPPQVTSVPDKREQQFPDAFPVCAVTHAMGRGWEIKGF